jgi:hypothetical protein
MFMNVYLAASLGPGMYQYTYIIYLMEDCIYQLMVEQGGSMLMPNLPRW